MDGVIFGEGDSEATSRAVSVKAHISFPAEDRGMVPNSLLSPRSSSGVIYWGAECKLIAASEWKRSLGNTVLGLPVSVIKGKAHTQKK